MTSNEQNLIFRVKEKRDEEALKELIHMHSGICIQIFNKYSNSLAINKVDVQDFYKTKDTLIFKAALSYSPEKSKFDTWVGNCARYYCLNTLRNNEKNFFEDYLEDVGQPDTPIDNNEKIMENAEQALEILSTLKDKRIYEVFKKRYFSREGLKTFAKISKEMNLSSSVIRELHAKGLKILKAKYK